MLSAQWSTFHKQRLALQSSSGWWTSLRHSTGEAVGMLTPCISAPLTGNFMDRYYLLETDGVPTPRSVLIPLEAGRQLEQLAPEIEGAIASLGGKATTLPHPDACAILSCRTGRTTTKVHTALTCSLGCQVFVRMEHASSKNVYPCHSGAECAANLRSSQRTAARLAGIAASRAVDGPPTGYVMLRECVTPVVRPCSPAHEPSSLPLGCPFRWVSNIEEHMEFRCFVHRTLPRGITLTIPGKI